MYQTKVGDIRYHNAVKIVYNALDGLFRTNYNPALGLKLGTRKLEIEHFV